MELLLILSALLSALTGAISGVRAPEVRSHQTAVEASAARVPAPDTARISLRPVFEAVTTRVTAASLPGAGVAFSLDPAIPLYAERRRE